MNFRRHNSSHTDPFSHPISVTEERGQWDQFVFMKHTWYWLHLQWSFNSWKTHHWHDLNLKRRERRDRQESGNIFLLFLLFSSKDWTLWNLPNGQLILWRRERGLTWDILHPGSSRGEKIWSEGLDGIGSMFALSTRKLQSASSTFVDFLSQEFVIELFSLSLCYLIFQVIHFFLPWYIFFKIIVFLSLL